MVGAKRRKEGNESAGRNGRTLKRSGKMNGGSEEQRNTE